MCGVVRQQAAQVCGCKRAGRQAYCRPALAWWPDVAQAGLDLPSCFHVAGPLSGLQLPCAVLWPWISCELPLRGCHALYVCVYTDRVKAIETSDLTGSVCVVCDVCVHRGC